MLNRKSWWTAACAAGMAAHGAAHEAHEAPAAARPAAKAQQASARASALPARKAGLWEITVRGDALALRRAGQAPQRPLTVQQCTGAEAEAVMLLSLLPGQENCRKPKVVRRAAGTGTGTGAGYDISTTCFVHGSRNDGQVELRGDLGAAYQGSYQVKFPDAPLNNTGRMQFEGRWLGACQPGQRPGDMVLPNGVTVNVVDDRKRAEEAHAHEGHDHPPGQGHKH